MYWANLSIKVNIRIKKYEEGANPDTGVPFEEVTKEVILYGEEALKVLKQCGGVE